MNHQLRVAFDAIPPTVLFALFVGSAVTVFFGCTYMLKSNPTQKPQESKKKKSEKEPVSEKEMKQQQRGKRQRRYDVKKEIRAMEMEEKRKQRQEKKEEAKVERAKNRKAEGKKEQQQKQKMRHGEEKISGSFGKAVTTLSIPRKRS